jgi:hypothetical protein
MLRRFREEDDEAVEVEGYRGLQKASQQRYNAEDIVLQRGRFAH